MSVELIKIHITVYILHLCKLGCPLSTWCYDAVAHKVALETTISLVHLGIIVARGVIVQTCLWVYKWLTSLYTTCVVDALVYPVPYTTAYYACTALYKVPIFLQIAHSLTHSMCILA